jgi:CHAD domain-containing protein
MPLRFKKSKSLAKSVRHMCRTHIDKARDCLRAGGRRTDVHGARKEIKKLRAMLRLLRWEIKRADYRRSAKALRKAATRLAPLRDARVILQVFEKLAGRSAPTQFPKIHKALQKNYRRELHRFRNGHSAPMASRMVKKTGRLVRELKIKATGWAAIEPALRQSCQQGREAFERVRANPLPEHFHEWRKHVKDLWYYFRLLPPDGLASTRARTDDLEVLGDRLGEDHDCFMLQQFIAANCPDHAKETGVLNKLIKTRQRQLRGAALKLGSRRSFDGDWRMI